MIDDNVQRRVLCFSRFPGNSYHQISIVGPPASRDKRRPCRVRRSNRSIPSFISSESGLIISIVHFINVHLFYRWNLQLEIVRRRWRAKGPSFATHGEMEIRTRTDCTSRWVGAECSDALVFHWDQSSPGFPLWSSPFRSRSAPESYKRRARSALVQRGRTCSLIA